MKKLFLLFNHQLTERQRNEAEQVWQAGAIIDLPFNIRELWRNLPPDVESLVPVLEPVRHWLSLSGTSGDFVLIQGDFGATWLMVAFARNLGLVPIYSTTKRIALEHHLDDGSVQVIHCFEHIRFREYGR